MAAMWHSLATTLRLMARNKVGFAGFLGVVFFVLLSFAGPLFVTLDETTKLDQIYAPLSLATPPGDRLFGT